MKRFFILLMSLALSGGVCAAEGEFTPEQRKQIEQIVREYIIQNPDVLIEASKILEAQHLEGQEKAKEEAIAFFRKDKGTPHRRGNGKHYLVEFFDYNCGYCKKARVHTQKLVKERNIDAYYIEFPILSQASVQAAAIGLALYEHDPQKYFKYQDYLMGKEEKLVNLEQMREALRYVKADVDRVMAISKHKRIRDALLRNLSLGKEMGVAGTPYFVIDGTTVLGGFNASSDLEQYLKK